MIPIQNFLLLTGFDMTYKTEVTSNIINTKIHTPQNIHFSENLQNYPNSKY